MAGDEDGPSASTLALFGQITTTIAELKQQNIQLIEIQRKQGEMLIRIDERQSEWATKRELGEATAGWQLALQPVAGKAESAHHRLDAYRAELAEAVTAVRVDFEERDKKIETLEEVVLKMRLGWTKATGIIIGAGLVGGGTGGLLSKLLGG
jgi:hypothetical protein